MDTCWQGGLCSARKASVLAQMGKKKLWQESEKHTALIPPVVVEVGESCFIFSILSSFYIKHIYIKYSNFILALILNLVIDINVLNQFLIDMLQIRKTNAWTWVFKLEYLDF